MMAGVRPLQFSLHWLLATVTIIGVVVGTFMFIERARTEAHREAVRAAILDGRLLNKANGALAMKLSFENEGQTPQRIAPKLMRYRLSTLLIVLALGPPLLAWIIGAPITDYFVFCVQFLGEYLNLRLIWMRHGPLVSDVTAAATIVFAIMLSLLWLLRGRRPKPI
jgi:hypothetical protein